MPPVAPAVRRLGRRRDRGVTNDPAGDPLQRGRHRARVARGHHRRRPHRAGHTPAAPRSATVHLRLALVGQPVDDEGVGDPGRVGQLRQRLAASRERSV